MARVNTTIDDVTEAAFDAELELEREENDNDGISFSRDTGKAKLARALIREALRARGHTLQREGGDDERG